MPERQFFCETVRHPPSKHFPQGKVYQRPYIYVGVRHADRVFGLDALVDTGSDRCSFPILMGIQLGLIAEWSAPDALVSGSGGDAPVFYRDIMIEIPNFYRWSVLASFTQSCDQLGIGVLGYAGFLDRFRVRLDLEHGSFFVTPPSN